MLTLPITLMNIGDRDDRSVFTVFRSLETASPQAKREKLWVSTVKLAAVSNRISECRVIPSARLAVTNTPMRLWAVGEEFNIRTLPTQRFSSQFLGLLESS
jgi:hypothetical protein